MAHRRNSYREKLADAPAAAGSARSWPAAPSLLQGFLWGKKPFLLAQGRCAQKCRVKAGSYQTPRRSLLWTSETVTQIFTVQEPSDPLPVPQRGCVLSCAAALPLGEKESQRLEGMREVAQDDARGSSWQQTLCNPRRRTRERGKKGASLTSPLPLPFFF